MNIIKLFEKMISILFLIVFLVCSFFSLFHFEKYSLLFQHSILKTVLFASIAAGILIAWDHLLKGKNDKKSNVIRIVTAFILILIQVYLFLKVMTPIGWDVLEVVNSAEYGMYNGDYFAKYPNNLFTQLFLSIYLKAVGFIPYLSSLRKFELLNLFFVDISILLGVLTAKKIYGIRAADRVFCSSVLLIGFHPTLSVIYSDTLAMPFPIGILFCLVYGMDTDKTVKRTVFFSLGAILGVIGYCIKPTAIIIEIAILIMIVLRWKKDFLKPQIIIPVLIALLTCFMTYEVVNIIEQPIKNELQKQYPDIKPRGVLHYIALGLCVPDENTSGYGSWNETEVIWMQQHINDLNYTQEAIEHIKSKLTAFGCIGFLEHLANKLIWAGSDGTFFYGGEGDFHLDEQASQSTLRGKLQNAFYIETDFYQKWFSSWMQGVWLLICIRGVLSYFKKEDNVFTAISKLSILGLFLFLLFFENRSRYLFLYLPVFLLAVEINSEVQKNAMDM